MRLVYYSVRYFRRKIRISASYLFRVRIDGKYLLVKSNRWHHYQPVGGVYKVSDGAKQFLDDIGALDDDLVPIDEASLHDLRLRIPATKLIPFLRWFESGRSRETSPWREFYEELLKTKTLPSAKFPFVLDNFIRRDIRKIRFSPYSQSLELMIADIHELLPTPDQLLALQQLEAVRHPDVIWATEDRIRRLGASPGANLDAPIAETAEWIL